MNYILIGFKSSGKSTTGQSLAEKLNLEFIDIDQIIVQLDGKGRNWREIFNQSGEKYFRDLETMALDSLKNKDHSVIALGGGALEKKINQPLIRQLGKLIYLDCDQKVIFERIKKSGLPKFIDSFETFQQLYNKRSATFNNFADIKINCTNKSVEEITAEIIANL